MEGPNQDLFERCQTNMLTRGNTQRGVLLEMLPWDRGYAIYRVRIVPAFSLPCTKRGNVARDSQARDIPHHALWVRKRKCCIFPVAGRMDIFHDVVEARVQLHAGCDRQM